MKYDFTEVRKRFHESGMTLADFGHATAAYTENHRPIHYTTIGKAFDRGAAHQRTAKAMAKVFRIPFWRLTVNSDNSTRGTAA